MGWSDASRFYEQLGGLLRAGLNLGQALEHAGTAATGRYRRDSLLWSRGCASGRTFAEQLEADHEPPFATAIIAAGEASGRLPELCLVIARHYDHAARVRRAALGRLVYPAVLLHVSLILPVLPAVVLGTSPPIALLYGPLVLWATIGAGAFALRLSRRGEGAARLALLPGIRALSLPLLTANICEVLGAAFAAGMLVPRALDLAAGACGNRVIGNRLRFGAAAITAGRMPDLTSAVRAAGLPAVTVQLIANAEHAGRLEDALGRAAANARESFEERSNWAGRILTSSMYLGAVVFAAIKIISMWMDYGTALNAAMKDASGG